MNLIWWLTKLITMAVGLIHTHTWLLWLFFVSEWRGLQKPLTLTHFSEVCLMSLLHLLKWLITSRTPKPSFRCEHAVHENRNHQACSRFVHRLDCALPYWIWISEFWRDFGVGSLKLGKKTTNHLRNDESPVVLHSVWKACQDRSCWRLLSDVCFS